MLSNLLRPPLAGTCPKCRCPSRSARRHPLLWTTSPWRWSPGRARASLCLLTLPTGATALAALLAQHSSPATRQIDRNLHAWQTRLQLLHHRPLPTMCSPSRHDLRSHVARQKLQVAFSDNPQTYGLELTGEVEFPNLLLDVQVCVCVFMCVQICACAHAAGSALRCLVAVIANRIFGKAHTSRGTHLLALPAILRPWTLAVSCRTRCGA